MIEQVLVMNARAALEAYVSTRARLDALEERETG